MGEKILTFLFGMILLLVGGYFYSLYVARGAPNDRKTPAFTHEDGVDFVPIGKRRNALIQLLNIADTGLILGPILGVLFGPVTFILIPLGNVFGGAVHDYLCGMISMRHDGAPMSKI